MLRFQARCQITAIIHRTFSVSNLSSVYSPLEMAFDSAEEQSTTTKYTGILGYSSLREPRHLTIEAEKSIRKATYLVDLVCSSSDDHKVVKRIDRISDILCSILDASEMIRNVHPDKEWLDAASNAFELLHNYLNQLNTHPGLYNVHF